MNMKTLAIVLVTAGAITVQASAASGADWLFAPSYYTHDPDTGQRVTQYAAKAPVHVAAHPVYQENGYHRSWSVLTNRNGSYDMYHINNEWGRYATPYYYYYGDGGFYFGPWTKSRAGW